MDDHRIVREGLREVIQREGAAEVVGEAEDGRSAVELVGRLVPDVVVMDVGMAGMNGVESTRRIKADNQRVKVIALSTYSDKRYVINMIKAGASGYVLKESASDDLLRAIREVSSGAVYLSPKIAGLVVGSLLEGKGTGKGTVYDVLGPREREVLQLIAEGMSSPQIAKCMGIKTRTVESHRRNIMRKLGLHSVALLTKYAVREGLSSLED